MKILFIKITLIINFIFILQHEVKAQVCTYIEHSACTWDEQNKFCRSNELGLKWCRDPNHDKVNCGGEHKVKRCNPDATSRETCILVEPTQKCKDRKIYPSEPFNPPPKPTIIPPPSRQEEDFDKKIHTPEIRPEGRCGNGIWDANEDCDLSTGIDALSQCGQFKECKADCTCKPKQTGCDHINKETGEYLEVGDPCVDDNFISGHCGYKDANDPNKGLTCYTI